MAALTSKAIELAVGTNSCSNSSCFGPSSMFVMVQPVRFPAGWLSLATKPASTGSTTVAAQEVTSERG